MFFFQCYADLRYLHSFPTRRSSDLFFREGQQLALCLHLHDIVLHQTVPRDRGGTDKHQRGVKTIRRCVDRKSTRLNSSHRCISYAVFCLKKKKSKEKETTS